MLQTTIRPLCFADLKAKGIPWTPQHIRRLEAAGQFPKRFHLGKNTVRWHEQDIDDWLAKQHAAEPQVKTAA